MSLSRRKPLAKKRTKPRRIAVSCSVLRCKHRPWTEGLCKTHAIRRADRVVGDFVKARDKGCVAVGEHKGSLQWAHIVSRRYRSIRWDPNNAVCLCAAHHAYFTMRPLEWDEWVEQRITPKRYAALKREALHGDLPDVADVIREFGGKA